MKARLEYDTERINPAYNRREHMKRGKSYRTSIYAPAPKGTIITAPDAFRLVQIGIAVPADDECRERCGMTEHDIAARVLRYESTHKGIWPEDRQRFEDGELAGYAKDEKGNIVDVPGPNADAADTYFDEAEYDE